MWIACRASCLVAALAAAAHVAAQAPAPDKSGHHLLNPTPPDLWRPLSADRPDATESPYTVDAGAVQVEASFFEYARDEHNHDDETVETIKVAPTNLKLGLTSWADIQFVFEPYVRQDTDPDLGAGATLDGFGGFAIRFKANVWGNDGGETALGVLPFIDIPFGNDLGTDEPGGGVAVPFAWQLSEGVSLGLMPQLAAVHDPDDDDHDLEFLHTAVLGFDVAGSLGAYVEYLGVASSDGGTDYAASLSTGLTYAVSENLLLDAGMLIGLTRDAEDLVAFSGLTVRF